MCVKESWEFSFILFMWFICSAPNIETPSTQKIQMYILMMVSCFLHNTRTSHNSRDRVRQRAHRVFGITDALSLLITVPGVCVCLLCVGKYLVTINEQCLLHIAPCCPKSGTGGLIDANTWGWKTPEPETHQDFGHQSAHAHANEPEIKIDWSLRRENSGLRRP